MKIMLTGGGGQLAWELERALAPLGEVLCFDRATLDLGDAAALARRVRELRPDVVVNAAAFTAVDRAEAESELAQRVNGIAPGVLAEEARRAGALMVHYSTDYVFDGAKQAAYVESDPPNPINAYGRSKLAGERAVAQAAGDHLILRTCWLYGARGQNFLRTILRLALTRERLRVVSDQVGKPTWVRPLAEATGQILAQRIARAGGESGLFHLACAGETSWHGFARAILEEFAVELDRRPALEAISTPEYPLPAARPANSRLDCGKLQRAFGLALPDWRKSLSLCARDALQASILQSITG